MLGQLFSVVIPAYNAEPYITGTLQSVLEQVRPGRVDVEILVVDDKSTDGTLAKVSAVAIDHPGKIRVIQQQQNRGAAAARNTGLRHATGNFVCFLDADDQYVTGFFASCLPHFEQNPQLAAITTEIELVNCHREIHPIYHEITVNSIPSNVVLRTSVAHLLGGFPEDDAFRGRGAGEDIVFKVTLNQEFQVIRVKEKYLRYLVRPGSHFDFFLDRTEVVNGRIVFKELTPEEADGSTAAAGRVYHSVFRQRVDASALCKRSTKVNASIISELVTFEKLRAQFDNVKGFLHPIEGYALYHCAKVGPSSGSIVEIGSLMGRSTCWLAAGAKTTGREPVFAVDHFKGSPEHQVKGTHELEAIVTQNSTYPEFEANLKANNLMDWVRPRIGSSTEVARNWSGPIRLLFIDGDHSYHNSKTDFDCWSRFVPTDGLVAFHDIDVWPGVTQFYNELAAMTGWRLAMRALSLCVLQRIA